MSNFPIEDLLGRSFRDDLMVRFLKEFDNDIELKPDERELDILVYPRGFSLYLDYKLNKVTNIFYYSKLHFDHYKMRKANPYEGRLPFGLRFGMKFDEVREFLGEPVESSVGIHKGIPGGIGQWLKYHYDNNFAHLSFYKETGSLFNVAVTLKEANIVAIS